MAAISKANVILLIRDLLGFNNNISETIILRHMDLAQSVYEGGSANTPLPWFLFDEDATFTAVADDRTTSVPTGFIQLDEDWPVKAVDPDTGVHTELKRDSAANLIGIINDVGHPQYYSLDGTLVYTYPLQEVNTVVIFPCYKTSEALSTATTSGWFTYFPKLIIAETVTTLGAAVRDANAVKIAEGLKKVELVGYHRRIEEMKYKQRELSYGENG